MSSLLNEPDPRSRLGQGVRGGRSALPGLSDLPRLGSSGSSLSDLPHLHSSYDAPLLNGSSRLRPAQRGASAFEQGGGPSAKAHDVAGALVLLEQVHQGIIPWDSAKPFFDRGFTQQEKEGLKHAVRARYGATAIDTLRALGENTRPLDRESEGGSFFGNLFHDVENSAKGLFPGLYHQAQAIGQDVKYAAENPMDLGFVPGVSEKSKLRQEITEPLVQQYKETYGPLAHGHVGEFLHRVHQHPLGPITDALAVASMGTGAGLRVAAGATAAKAMRVSEIGGVTKVGAEVKGVNLSIHQMRNGLWQVQQGGKPYRSRFPTKESAVAHAQSLTTGGVHADDLSETIVQMYKPAKRELGFEEAIKQPRNFQEINPASVPEGEFGRLHRELVSHQAEWDQGMPGAHTSDMGMPGSHPQSTPSGMLMAEGAIGDAYQDGAHLLISRTGDKMEGIASYKPPHGNERSIEIGYVGVGNAGAGMRLMGELARKFPGKGFHFVAASQRLGRYYESLGFTRHADDPTTFTLSAENAAKFARGEAPVKGGITGRKVVGAELRPKSPLGAAIGAALGPSRGNLITAYDIARKKTHIKENTQIAQDVVMGVFGNENLRLDKRSLDQVVKDTISGVGEDLAATYRADVGKTVSRAEKQPGFTTVGGSAAITTMGVALREASDFIRAGAVYLRPAYLPNNWAGNAFMNGIQQGMWAPANMAKSLLSDKYIGREYTMAIDRAMGQFAAGVVTATRGHGYVASLTNPVAEAMGKIADQPFRRSAFYHAARRRGYHKMSDVRKLMDKAKKEAQQGLALGKSIDEEFVQNSPALREFSDMAREGQEEIVKFGRMNQTEKGVIRNLIFLWSWMRGAGRYFGRFPLAHPVQAAAYTHLGQVGSDWANKEMGGVPSFLIGSIPVGHDSKGNPILINPLTLNPLGTGIQEVEAAVGTADIIRNRDFNKFAQTDITSLVNPIIGTYLGAREGGKPVGGSLAQTVAIKRLIDDLQHPGRGAIFPTTRKEAVGRFVVGSLYPRKADQAAITRSLERQQVNHPIAMIPERVKQFEKATGQKVPQEFIDSYVVDLIKYGIQRDFQKDYARDHGSSGFRNLPPQNQADAALEYVTKYQLMPKDQLDQLKSQYKQIGSDEEFRAFASAVWSSTGVGTVKDTWDEMMRTAKGTQLSRPRE